MTVERRYARRHERRLVVTWLIDRSAYTRLSTSPDTGLWLERINRGLMHVAAVTRLEIGYSARSVADLEAEEAGLLGRLVPVLTPPRAEDRAVEVQRLLTVAGHHRGPGIPALLVAAVAETTGRTVLHQDHDFEDIARFTGQPVEQLLPGFPRATG